MYDRIRQLLIEHGLNDTELARIAGVGKSTVSGWRSEKFYPKDDKLQKIADYFGVSEEWIAGKDDCRTKDEQHTMDILFDTKSQKSHSKELFAVAAGQGRINGDYPSEPSNDIDYESGEYVDAVIHGDSMSPIIMDRDVITIHLETVTKPTQGKIYVVKLNGEATTIKYAEVVSDGIWIRAENKEVFEDKFYDIGQIMNLPIKILGTVVAVKRRL